MDVGPARQPRSPLAFPSGGWATFPMLGMFPHTHGLPSPVEKKGQCSQPLYQEESALTLDLTDFYSFLGPLH